MEIITTVRRDLQIVERRVKCRYRLLEQCRIRFLLGGGRGLHIARRAAGRTAEFPLSDKILLSREIFRLRLCRRNRSDDRYISHTRDPDRKEKGDDAEHSGSVFHMAYLSQWECKGLF
ncbi:hypothetical protein D3C86_1188260 [compost metagenome]